MATASCVAQCDVEGRFPELLEVVRFSHSGSVGDPAQPENVRVTGEQWERVGLLDGPTAYRRLEPVRTRGPALFGNQGRAVPADRAREGLDASLALVEPTNLWFTLEEAPDARKSPRAEFSLVRLEYSLPLTETLIRPRLLQMAPGRYDFEDLGLPEPERVLLTVSLAEEQNDWRSKLVAAVIAV